MSMADPFAVIRHRIEQQKSSIEQFLANGGAKDFIEYSRMVGEYAAIQKMEADLNEIEQRYIES